MSGSLRRLSSTGGLASASRRSRPLMFWKLSHSLHHSPALTGGRSLQGRSCSSRALRTAAQACMPASLPLRHALICPLQGARSVSMRPASHPLRHALICPCQGRRHFLLKVGQQRSPSQTSLATCFCLFRKLCCRSGHAFDGPGCCRTNGNRAGASVSPPSPRSATHIQRSKRSGYSWENGKGVWTLQRPILPSLFASRKPSMMPYPRNAGRT